MAESLGPTCPAFDHQRHFRSAPLPRSYRGRPGRMRLTTDSVCEFEPPPATSTARSPPSTSTVPSPPSTSAVPSPPSTSTPPSPPHHPHLPDHRLPRPRRWSEQGRRCGERGWSGAAVATDSWPLRAVRRQPLAGFGTGNDVRHGLAVTTAVVTAAAADVSAAAADGRRRLDDR